MNKSVSSRVFLATAISFIAPTAICADYYPHEVKSIDGNISCFERNVGFFKSTGSCKQFAAPKTVSLGDIFVANGKSRQITFILASQAGKDMKDYGMNISKGDITCLATESRSDYENQDHSAVWIYIRKCQTLDSAPEKKGLLQPLSVPEFLNIPNDFQVAYVGGLMEGMAFIQYNYSMPDYASWAECIRKKTLGDTTADVIAFIKESANFEESVSAALAKTLGRQCKN